MTTLHLPSAGLTLLTLVAVAYGGTFLLRVVNGAVPANDLQRRYFRAGHAHAGMLVTLGLLIQVITGDPRVPAWGSSLGLGVLWAAILMPAGFFLSVLGPESARPNRLRALIWAGALSLLVGIVGAACALLAAG